MVNHKSHKTNALYLKLRVLMNIKFTTASKNPFDKSSIECTIFPSSGGVSNWKFDGVVKTQTFSIEISMKTFVPRSTKNSLKKRYLKKVFSFRNSIQNIIGRSLFKF